jgi:hypothetical protein
MKISDERIDFFLNEIFLPLMEKYEANGIVKSWDGILAGCNHEFETNRRAIMTKAVDKGIAKDLADDWWLVADPGGLCNAGQRSRQNIRVALAEDGYKLRNINFTGVALVSDDDSIRDSYENTAAVLVGRSSVENAINDILNGIHPDLEIPALEVKSRT